MRIEKIYFRKNFQKFSTWTRSKSRILTYIYVIRRERVNKVIRKKIVLKWGLRHQGWSRNTFWKKIFGTGSVNTFPAAVFFENRQFSPKILKIWKCSSSLNFNDRKNLNPFLESLKPLLSNAHADREDLFSQDFLKIFNVNKVKIEDFDIYICHPQGTC